MHIPANPDIEPNWINHDLAEEMYNRF